ncbi:MAG TPA: sugar phosphate isomerase/epimerase [Egibacteraceae bacterium]|nr:sugar phosphate isomerase/epimerase [Egibacteraceae bacterium]
MRADNSQDTATRPRLLASTGPLSFGPLGSALETIADAGFQGAEVLVTRAPESRDPDRLLALASETGLDVPVVHGPYMVLLRGVLGAHYVEKSRRSLELAAAIGAQLLVAHAPMRWERGHRGWLAREAAGEAAAYGPRLGVENLFPVGGLALSSVITAAQLAAFPHVVFDTSHFGVAGIDLLSAWDALGERVAHIHLSDNLGGGRDSHAPIGAGTLPLEAFCARVAASGYDGTVTLELDCRRYLNDRTALVGFLSAQRRRAQRMLLIADETEVAPQ